MSVKTIVAVNTSKLISIDNGDPICTILYEGSTSYVTSDGTDRTASGWLDYIDVTEPVEYDLADGEFTKIQFTTFTDGLTITSESLAEAIGFEYNVLYEPEDADDFYGTLWGTHRLVLQGSESEDSKGVAWTSMILAPERVNGKVNNETWESINYVVNSYDKRFDMKRWSIPCHYLGTEKEQWVRDFLHACGSGRDSDSVVIYGDGHWIKDTETWKLLTNQYNGIEVDLGHALLVQFSIGLRLIIQ